MCNNWRIAKSRIVTKVTDDTYFVIEIHLIVTTVLQAQLQAMLVRYREEYTAIKQEAIRFAVGK